MQVFSIKKIYKFSHLYPSEVKIYKMSPLLYLKMVFG